MPPETVDRPRVGIPWRTSAEEASNKLGKTKNYQDAVQAAGGEPVLLSLQEPGKLKGLLATLDGFVLPGSPADVNPSEYGAVDRGKSAPADVPRETTDRTILEHALGEKKPVLAICYGCQLLNVYLGGTLIQDLPTETGTTMPHSKDDLKSSASRIAGIAKSRGAQINSSHHQAVEKPGKNLRVTAHAPDGTIEAIEWTGDENWVVGVQWHPERMVGDAFSERLFSDFIAAARNARGTLARNL
jgi:putative glutamine amidotransferase